MIKPILNLSSRTSTAEIELKNINQEIKPGMYANVELALEKHIGTFIPLNSIYRQAGTGNEYVWVVNDQNKVKRILIERVQTIGSNVIVKGVDKGMKVVIYGKNKLSEGSIVKVSNRK